MQPTEWRPTKRAREAAARDAKRLKESAPRPPPAPPLASPPQRTPSTWRLKWHVNKQREHVTAPPRGSLTALVKEVVESAIDTAVRDTLDELHSHESLYEQPTTISAEYPSDAPLELVPHDAQMPDWMAPDEYDLGQLR